MATTAPNSLSRDRMENHCGFMKMNSMCYQGRSLTLFRSFMRIYSHNRQRCSVGNRSSSPLESIPPQCCLQQRRNGYFGRPQQTVLQASRSEYSRDLKFRDNTAHIGDYWSKTQLATSFLVQEVRLFPTEWLSRRVILEWCFSSAD